MTVTKVAVRFSTSAGEVAFVPFKSIVSMMRSRSGMLWIWVEHMDKAFTCDDVAPDVYNELCIAFDNWLES